MTISISARIQRTLLALSIVLCSVFAAITMLLIYIVEDRVFTLQLSAERQAFSESGFSNSWQPTNRHIRKLNSAKELPRTLPFALRQKILSNEGIYEYFDNSRAMFIAHYTKPADGEAYFLSYDVSSYLAVRGNKPTFATFILATTLIVIAIAILFSRRLTKRILAPIRRLTDTLNNSDNEHFAIQQAKQFSADEIGLLTRELALALQSSHDAAQREYEFNRGVSHELRTPMQAAQSATELLLLAQQQHTHNEASQQQKYLERLQRAICEMHQVVEAFLWLSQGHQRNKNEYCSTHAVCEACCENHDIKVVVCSAVTAHHTYPLPENVLLIILRNLIRNAFTHSDGQNIEITFDTDKISITNPYQEQENKACRNTLSSWGIGLSIVKRLAEYFNCQLIIHHEDNSLFSVNLLMPVLETHQHDCTPA